ncbi:DUF2818 family protein [Cupriavidus basilensis]
MGELFCLVCGRRSGRLRRVSAGLGNAFPQGWQFYAITGCMMLVFAFPGFTWQYLVKHRAASRPVAMRPAPAASDPELSSSDGKTGSRWTLARLPLPTIKA